VQKIFFKEMSNLLYIPDVLREALEAYEDIEQSLGQQVAVTNRLFGSGASGVRSSSSSSSQVTPQLRRPTTTTGAASGSGKVAVPLRPPSKAAATGATPQQLPSGNAPVGEQQHTAGGSETTETSANVNDEVSQLLQLIDDVQDGRVSSFGGKGGVRSGGEGSQVDMEALGKLLLGADWQERELAGFAALQQGNEVRCAFEGKVGDVVRRWGLAISPDMCRLCFFANQRSAKTQTPVFALAHPHLHTRFLKPQGLIEAPFALEIYCTHSLTCTQAYLCMQAGEEGSSGGEVPPYADEVSSLLVGLVLLSAKRHLQTDLLPECVAVRQAVLCRGLNPVALACGLMLAWGCTARW
jgi:hypothetical protein